MEECSLPVAADMAILQINLEQHDFVRFNLDGSDFYFCCMSFGITCSLAYLNSSLKLLYDSFESDFADTINFLRQCIYVDDVLTCFPDERSMLRFMEASIELFNRTSINLRGWTSSPEKGSWCKLWFFR